MQQDIGTVQHIRLDELLVDHDFNCRGFVGGADIFEFAKAIDRDGLQNPVIVVPYRDAAKPQYKYKLIAGFRRTAAFKHLKRETIPALVKTGLSNLDEHKINLLENIQRRELNIKQEAHALIIFRDAGWLDKDMAEQFQQSTGWVKIRLMLLDLPDDIQDEAAAGLLTQEHIKHIWNLPMEKQYAFVKGVKEAKARGEKVKIDEPARKINPHARKERKRAEIFEMIENLWQITGMGLHTRCLAWAAGECSEYELMKDVEEWCKENGKEYTIPAEMVLARIQ